MSLESKPKISRTKRPPRVKGLKLNACQRSLAWLRKGGWMCDVAEKYISHVSSKDGVAGGFKGGYRKDLMGFIDVLAIRGPDQGAYPEGMTLAVQTTSRMQVSAHLRAYREDPELRQGILAWLDCQTRRFVIHGWEAVSVPKKDGKGDKVMWTVLLRDVTPADLI